MSRMLARDSLRMFATTAPLQALPTLASKHGSLARQHLNAERYQLARHHARLALAIEPGKAAAMLDLAAAWESDPSGSDDRSCAAYRRAAKLDPSDALTWAKLARSAMRSDHETLAKKALARAVRLAPADAGVLAVLLETCREAGWDRKATKLLIQARFLSPRSNALKALWNRNCFDSVVRGQKPAHERGPRDVLPFLRISAM